MKLLRLEMCGITRFSEPVAVDFEALGGGVVAISAGNGFGKTSICEASGPGALFFEMPTRKPKSLKEWMDPKGYLNLDFEFGAHRYRIEHRHRSSAIFRDGEARSLNPDKLRGTFSAEIEKLFGSPEVFYSSVFAAQGGAGAFTSLSVSDRKKVLRHHFGLDRLEAVSGEAKARLKACDVPGLVSAKRFAIEAEDRWTLTRRKQADARGEQQAAMERLKEAREEAEKSLELLQLAGPLQAYSDLASRAVDLKDKLATERERLRQDLPDPARAKLAVSKERKKEADRRDLQADLRGLGVEGERLRIRQEEAEAALALSNTAPCMGTKLEFSCQVLKEARGRDCPSHEDFEKVERRTKTVEGKLIQIGEPNVQAAEGQVVVVERNERLRLQSLETKSALDKVRHQMRMARKELPKELPEGSLIQDAKAAARARDAAEKAYTEAALKAGGADQDVERAFNRHEEAQLHLKRAQESAADAGAYEFLAKAFGRNGIQAHEVDYKAPKLEAYANEILQAGWPNRFRLELRTQRDRKGVSRQHAENRIESLDVVVHDALRARMGTAESVSGGERVLLDEALRTAQALIASESGGWDSRMMTAWRDEVPAVLYGEVARRHVAMLAKARELGGFHQILFVGGPVAAAVADAVIEITEDGRIECTRN